MPLTAEVGLVALSYSGPDIDAALQEFSEKVRSAIPNVTCVGWNLNAQIDSEQVRKLNQPARAGTHRRVIQGS